MCRVMCRPERDSRTFPKRTRKVTILMFFFSPPSKSKRGHRAKNGTQPSNRRRFCRLSRLPPFSVGNVSAAHTSTFVDVQLRGAKSPSHSRRSLTVCFQAHLSLCCQRSCLHDLFPPKSGLLSEAPGGYCILQEEQQGSSLSGWAA